MTSPHPVNVQNPGQQLPAGHEPANLGDLLERVLDRGLVIAGDIRVSLLDIELLTLKLRLVIASVDTARQIGIDWWEHDPWLTSAARRPIESGAEPRDAIEPGSRTAYPERPPASERHEERAEEY